MYSLSAYDDLDYGSFGTGSGEAVPLEDYDFGGYTDSCKRTHDRQRRAAHPGDRPPLRSPPGEDTDRRTLGTW